MRVLARLGGGVFVLAGYLLVAVGQQIEFWSLGGSLDPKGMFTLEFATSASYVIFGVAWFVHLRVIIPRPGNAGHVRWTMWLFAIASALLAVGWVAEIRDLVGGPHGYSSLPTETIAGLALTAFGFAVVFVGFFWAGKSIGIGEAKTIAAEPDNPSSNTASVPAEYETSRSALAVASVWPLGCPTDPVIGDSSNLSIRPDRLSRVTRRSARHCEQLPGARHPF